MVSDSDMLESRYNYQFIHGVLANFYSDTMDYFSDYLYPRFQWKIIGTYEKAVESIRQAESLGRDPDKPELPGIILNPSADLTLAETNSKQLYRFPNYIPLFAKRLYTPLYQDQHVIVYPGFTRIRGTIELFLLLPSIYELFDLQIFLILMFGGLDRIIRPINLDTYIILPDEVKNYTYSNEYTGLTYSLDWAAAGAYDLVVRTTNRNEVVYPCRIVPNYKLTGLSDSSTRFGGTDSLADYRLNATIEYEVEIPTFMILEHDWLADNLIMNIKYESVYSTNTEYQPDANIQKTTFNRPSGLNATENTDDLTKTEAANITTSISSEKNLVFKTRYFHIITSGDQTSATTFEFVLPEQINDTDTLVVNGKHGELDYGDHYEIRNSGTTIFIKNNITNFVAGDILELYIYEEI